MPDAPTGVHRVCRERHPWPATSLELLPDTGHLLVEERPAEVADRIQDFLAAAAS